MGALFELITAIRFLLNAEDTLGRDVMKISTKLLVPKGILVSNNHENHTSFVGTLGRAIGRYKRRSISTTEVEDPFVGAGLPTDTCFPLGVLPFNEKWCPRRTSMLRTFELAVSKIPFFRYCAQNNIYVCRKPKE